MLVKSIKKTVMTAILTAIVGWAWQNRQQLLPQVFGEPTTRI